MTSHHAGTALTGGLADVAEEADGDTDLGNQQKEQGSSAINGAVSNQSTSSNALPPLQEYGQPLQSTYNGAESQPGSRRVSHDANGVGNHKVCKGHGLA